LDVAATWRRLLCDADDERQRRRLASVLRRRRLLDERLEGQLGERL